MNTPRDFAKWLSFVACVTTPLTNFNILSSTTVLDMEMTLDSILVVQLMDVLKIIEMLEHIRDTLEPSMSNFGIKYREFMSQ